MRAPNGLAEVAAFYGDPSHFIKEDGTISPLWDMRMVSVALPHPLPLGWDLTRKAKSMRVNTALADEAAEAFAGLDKAGLWDFIVTYDGGYCWRTQRGSSRLSMHALGAAIDINANTNKLGQKPTMPIEVVDFLEARGWTWGGRWHRPDGMHFQWGKDY